MRNALLLALSLILAMGLSACGSKAKDDDKNSGSATSAACSDGLDNDGDGFVDYPADPGCSSPGDTDETDPPPPPACSDGLDNDNDGKIDYPNDPGCTDANDTDEADPVPAKACADGIDNDNDGKTDFPDDPGCESAADDDETDPVTPAACSDGLDNDNDGKIDYPNDPGCDNAADDDETDPPSVPTRTRYEMNNQCWALKANGTGNFVVRNSNGYAATATSIDNAEPFYMKPSALGKYLFYNRNRQLMSTSGPLPLLRNVATADATDFSEWTVTGAGDTTAYPPTPIFNREPTSTQVAAYHNFVDPNLKFSAFTVRSDAAGTNLAVETNTGNLVALPAALISAQSFSFEPLEMSKCSQFPEAQSNFTGEPFKGKRADGTVLGHADVHVHISATTFLGGAHWGTPYHKFGVEHALGNCSRAHGPDGQLDLVGGVFGADTGKLPNDFQSGQPTRQFEHDTRGWPDFPDWPSRDMLTHEAIYWKWLERAWASGLRVVVNDLVDNETLCELQRNASGDPLRDCNSMNTAGQQVGTMYGMQDYIDAQYGGRGKGFFQIVHSPTEGRNVIEQGNIAVVLGIEISEVLNCKVKYSPFRTQQPFQENGSGFGENSYSCTMEEGKPNSILTQLQRLHGWGVRQIIAVHEFDNAFGGNGIFDGLVLNLGNREDTGGMPSGDVSSLLSLISPSANPDQYRSFLENLPYSETPTGEWWTTYNCPSQGQAGFTGYLWGNSGGSKQSYLSPEDNGCTFMGQGGRAGGPTPCYPKNKNQCNARWMTPIGQYAFGKMMEMGFLIDWDHMELGTKTQLLELTEAQDPVYPIVSTHGTFGGTSKNQATRLLANGGFLYPSNGSSRGFRTDMQETLTLHTAAMNLRSQKNLPPLLFGFGYGTDTNGLSAQTSPRGSIPSGKNLTYPFDFFGNGVFARLDLFKDETGTQVPTVSFDIPSSTDLDGNVKRTWQQDIDGNAHYGMLSDFVQEIVLEGADNDIKHLFNSAEAYLQTWERTEAAKAAIVSTGLKAPNETLMPVLRAAPRLDDYNSTVHGLK